jgi:hypothetical protein
MRTVLLTLWYSLGAIALLITIIVGSLTIIEKVRAMCGDFYRDFVAFRLWRTAKQVLVFMKRTHPKTDYKVDEIATALKLSVRQTWDALEKLETKGKVTRSTVDQVIGGALWALDELER